MYINMPPHGERLARRCVSVSERQIGRRVAVGSNESEANEIAISPVDEEAEDEAEDEAEKGEDDRQ